VTLLHKPVYGASHAGFAATKVRGDRLVFDDDGTADSLQSLEVPHHVHVAAMAQKNLSQC